MLAFGANDKIRNAKGQSPIYLAQRNVAKYLCHLAGRPAAARIKPVPEAIDVNLDSNEIRNSRLDCLVSDRNIFKFAYWMEKHLEIKDTQDNASIDDFDVHIKPEVLQHVELRRWQETAKPVRPGGRVLFLDGGGVRGLILVEMLMEIERRTGRKITELFDWFIGTSIGSVVAAGLVYGELPTLVT